MLTITVEDLDLAGNQANKFNEVSNKGSDVVVKLNQCIENLKTNWIGSDAYAHIRSLVEKQNTLFDVCQNSVQISYETVQVIRAMQEVRAANGGASVSVSSPTITSLSGQKSDLTGTSETSAYNIKEEAEEGYNLLIETQNRLEDFYNEYTSAYSTLTNNWTAGGHIEELHEIKAKLDSNIENMKQVIADAATNLRTALDNIMGLN